MFISKHHMLRTHDLRAHRAFHREDGRRENLTNAEEPQPRVSSRVRVVGRHVHVYSCLYLCRGLRLATARCSYSTI